MARSEEPRRARQSASLLGRLDIMIHTATLQVSDKNAANRALQPIAQADHYVLDIISDAWCALREYCVYVGSFYCTSSLFIISRIVRLTSIKES